MNILKLTNLLKIITILLIAGSIFIAKCHYPNFALLNSFYIVVILLASLLTEIKYIWYGTILVLTLLIAEYNIVIAGPQQLLANNFLISSFIMLNCAALLSYFKNNIKQLLNRLHNQQAILDTTTVPIVTVNHLQKIESASKSIQQIYGYTPTELIGTNFTDLLTEPFASQYQQYFKNPGIAATPNSAPIIAEVLVKRSDQVIMPCELAIVQLNAMSGKPPFFNISMHDISERKQFEEKLLWSSNHDELTGIFNRRYFNTQIDIEWNRLKRGKAWLGLIIFDVDNFKNYNDTLGHIAGDDCLKNIALSATRVIQRAGDIVARFGGEEFVLLLPNTDPNGVASVAKKLQQAIATLDIPHPYSTCSKQVTVSMGLSAIVPNNSCTFDVLLAQADHALYQTKKAGKNNFTLYQDQTP